MTTTTTTTKNAKTILYVSTEANKIAIVKVDDLGNLIETVQTIDAVVDPLPDGVQAPSTPSHKLGTEWIDKHPQYKLLFVLTSFWSVRPAILTTFRIETDGRLTKLAHVSTGGFQACYATFSPDGSTYCVAHHNCGRVVFFDITNDRGITEGPLPTTIRAPIVDPDPSSAAVIEPQDSTMGVGVPCAHHVLYAPNRKYLLVVDAIQHAVLTYAVDERGRPIADNNDQDDAAIQPTSSQIVTTDQTNVSWFQNALKWILSKLISPGFPQRIRRAAVHPSGRFIYVLYEFANAVQVYGIDDTGKMDATCLCDLKIAEIDTLTQYWWIGVGITAAAEMTASSDGLIVSVRGKPAPGCRADSCVRTLSYVDEGRQLAYQQRMETPSAVRHFACALEPPSVPGEDPVKVLWVGINSASYPMVQKYRMVPSSENYELTGEANVGMDVFCVVPLPVSEL